MLTLLGGYVLAAGLHLRRHYENRDGDPGFSLADLTSAYSGLRAPSPLLTALRDQHPSDLPDQSRQSLITWLESGRISEDYDNLDLGDASPAVIIEENCLSCHAGRAEAGGGLALEYWDQIERIAYSKQIERVPDDILLASAHAHAPTMAVITIVIALLALLTSWPRALIGALIGVAGAALLVDLGSWWLARSSAMFVPVIAGAGIVHVAAVSITMVLILGDMWMPARQAGRPRN